MIYFDNSSTTSVRTEVCRVYEQLLHTAFANPDAMHRPGRDVHAKMETARQKIAQMLNRKPDEILFTSSASESNSLAIIGYCLAYKNRGNHILTTNVEHASVDHSFSWLETMGFEVQRMPVNEQGILTPEVLKQYMRKDTILVSCMHVNNEMGAINPIEELASIVHQNPTCVFHADCVQSFTKIDIPWKDLDLATVSMHKIHGLKGSSLLIKNQDLKLKPLIQGGQQEQGYRGGTSNAPSNIVAAKTIRLALEEKELQKVKGCLEDNAIDLSYEGIEPEFYEGFILQDIQVVTARELFVQSPVHHRYQKTFKEGKILEDVMELEKGDYVVHEQYGIGQYCGIVTRESHGKKLDYLYILYRNNDELYVPLSQFQLVRKYISKEGAGIQLSSLGSNAWKKTKEKVSEKVEEIAARLVELYSLRNEDIGYAFPQDDALQQEFEDAFPYESTPDQLRATAEIKKEMEKPKPMDHLLCGDVGFGKTEVAMRCAFKAISSGKQVAF